MDRAALADEARAEALKYTLDLQKGAPVGARRVAVEDAFDVVLRKRRRTRDFAGGLVYLDHDPGMVERLHCLSIEARHVRLHQGDLHRPTVIRSEDERFAEEVEFQIERPLPSGYPAGGQAPGG